MYKVWYWALIEQTARDTFVAHLPDLPGIEATGPTEKGALASLTELAASHVQQLVEEGHTPPRASQAAEIASAVRSKEINRALIPVDVARELARPGARYNVER
jgi:predicted RNase H-like HicB family nuclease